MSVVDYPTILMYCYRGRQWSIYGNDYENISWHDDGAVPTKEEMDSRWEEAIALVNEEQENASAAKQALLERLGITADEARLLLS